MPDNDSAVGAFRHDSHTSPKTEGLDILLCEACRTLDFTAIFSDYSHEKPQATILRLGTREEQARRINKCAGCRLFLAAHEQSPGDHPPRLAVCVVDNNTTDAQEKLLQPSLPFILKVLRTQRTRPYQPLNAFYSAFIQPLSFIRSDSVHLGSPGPRLMPRTFSDYSTLTKWIHQCQQHHGGRCRAPAKQISGLKCIDCSSGHIVELSENDRYYALSYVWGRANTLPAAGYPPVVRDAIEIVLGLSGKYLWVDKYCIEQNDSDARHEDIRRMDQIYEGAHATIIASAGRSADDGIPGIGQTERRQQSSARMGNHTLVLSVPDLSDNIRHSKWNTRGWTYQEAMLSRRCLYFTNTQLYFVCPGMVRSEGGPIHGKGTGLRTSSESQSELVMLASHIVQYSSRQLTFESDILNALRGLLRRSTVPTYFGIPISAGDDQESASEKGAAIGFAKGLFWEPGQRHLFRRNHFPSWSWVGWKGKVDYTASRIFPVDRPPGLVDCDASTFGTEFWIELRSDELVSLSSLVTSQTSRMLPEISPFLYIDAWTTQLHLQSEGVSFRGDRLRIFVCRCHPHSEHRGGPRASESCGTVILCQHPSPGDPSCRKLFGQLWTGVVLFGSSTTDGLEEYILLVERDGDTAHRIGTVIYSGGEFEAIPRRRERIRLA